MSPLCQAHNPFCKGAFVVTQMSTRDMVYDERGV